MSFTIFSVGICFVFLVSSCSSTTASDADALLHRAKRAVPNNVTEPNNTLTVLSVSSNTVNNLQAGNLIKMEYKSVWPAIAVARDVVITIFMPTGIAGATGSVPLFNMGLANFTTVGNNFNFNGTEASQTMVYNDPGSNGRYDKVTFTLENMTNSGILTDPVDNTFTIAFSAIVSGQPAVVVPNTYYISAVTNYAENGVVSTVRLDFNVTQNPPNTNENNGLSVSAPSAKIAPGMYGIVTIKITMKDLYGDITLDVYPDVTTKFVITDMKMADDQTDAFAHATGGMIQHVTTSTVNGQMYSTLSRFKINHVINEKYYGGGGGGGSNIEYIKILVLVKLLPAFSSDDKIKCNADLVITKTNLYGNDHTTNKNSDADIEMETDLSKIDDTDTDLPPWSHLYNWISELGEVAQSDNRYTRTTGPVFANMKLGLFANITIPFRSFATYTATLNLPHSSIKAQVDSINLIHVGQNLVLNNTFSSSSYSIYTSFGVTLNKVVINFSWIYNSGLYRNIPGASALVLEFIVNIPSSASGSDVADFTAKRSGGGTDSTTSQFTLEVHPWDAAIGAAIQEGNVYKSTFINGGTIHARSSQMVYIDLITVGNRLNLPPEPIRVNTPHRVWAIFGTRVSSSKYTTDFDQNYLKVEYNSSMSGSLYEEALISYDRPFISNVARFNYENEADDRRIRIYVYLTSVVPIPAAYMVSSNYPVNVTANNGIAHVQLLFPPAGITTPVTGPINRFLVTSASDTSITQYSFFSLETGYDTYTNSIDKLKIYAIAGDSNVRVCSMRISRMDENIAPFVSYRTMTTWTRTSQTSHASAGILDLVHVTNLGIYSSGSIIYVQTTFAVNPTMGVWPTVGTSFPISVVSETSAGNTTTSRSLTIVTPTLTASTSGVDVSFDMRNGSTSLPIGVPHTAIFTVTTKSAAHHKMSLSFYTSKTSASTAAKADLCDVHVVSAQWNLPCVDDINVQKIYTDTFGTLNGIKNEVIVDLGYVKNHPFKSYQHQFTVEIMVLPTLAASIGSTISVTGNLHIDDNIEKSDTVSFTVSDNMPAVTFPANITAIPPVKTTFEIMEFTPFSYDIYLSEITNTLKIEIFSGYHMLVSDTSFTYVGMNYPCVNLNPPTEYSALDGTTNKAHSAILFVNITNTGRSKRSTLAPHTDFDDRLTFQFFGRAVPGYAGSHNFTVRFTWGEFSKNITTDIVITSPPNPSEDLDFVIHGQSIENFTGSSMLFYASIFHTTASRLATTTASFYFFLPQTVKVIAVGNTTTESQPVNATILTSGNTVLYYWSSIYFLDNVTVSVLVSLLDQEDVMMWGQESLAVAGYLTFSSVNVVKGPTQFMVPIPLDALYPPLGMASGSILDCQITASGSKLGVQPSFARPTHSTGWISLGRGPPFYNNEYIQVNLNSLYKLNAITLYPGIYNSTEQFVTAIRVQYSLDGEAWNEIVDKNFAARTLTATYSGTPKRAVFPFGFYVKGQYVRVIPQDPNLVLMTQSPVIAMKMEVHGTIVNSSIIIDPCAPPSFNISEYYSERSYIVDHTNSVVYACMEDPFKVGLCHMTPNKGVTWFSFSDVVSNVVFVGDDNYIYGILKDKRSYAKSTNNGISWSGIPEYEFVNKYATNIALAKPVPFNGDFSVGSTYQITNAYGQFKADSRGVKVKVGGSYVHFCLWGDESWI